MSKLAVQTELGDIALRLRPDAAPITVDYIVKAAKSGIYDGTSFYRSDFVIQCGLHGTGRSPPGNIPINETKTGTFVSNTRGTVSIAHWDVPDCGNTEFFVNLKANQHLGVAYGVIVCSPRWRRMGRASERWTRSRRRS